MKNKKIIFKKKKKNYHYCCHESNSPDNDLDPDSNPYRARQYLRHGL